MDFTALGPRSTAQRTRKEATDGGAREHRAPLGEGQEVERRDRGRESPASQRMLASL